MSDPIAVHRALAAELHRNGVPCPDRDANRILLAIISGLDDQLQKPDLTGELAGLFKSYQDALVNITAIWIGHQAIVFARPVMRLSVMNEGGNDATAI